MCSSLAEKYFNLAAFNASDKKTCRLFDATLSTATHSKGIISPPWLIKKVLQFYCVLFFSLDSPFTYSFNGKNDWHFGISFPWIYCTRRIYPWYMEIGANKMFAFSISEKRDKKSQIEFVIPFIHTDLFIGKLKGNAQKLDMPWLWQKMLCMFFSPEKKWFLYSWGL